MNYRTLFTKFSVLSVTAILLSLCTLAGAQSPTFTTIENPGDPTFNQLLGINNKGVISGYFGSGAAGHPNKAYTIAPPYTNFLPANLPASTQSQATGINDAGVVVGFWSPTNQGTGDSNYGYLRQADGFTYLSINFPVSAAAVVNQLLGIKGTHAVGFYSDATGSSHGYVYNIQTGKFRLVKIQGAVSSAVTGLNVNNVICGFYTGTNGVTYGFTQNLQTGLTQVFSVPGAITTQLLGINDNGDAVGFYQLTANDITHGLIYHLSTLAFQTIDAPLGVNGTVLNGINNNKQAVGFFSDPNSNVDGLLVNNAY